MPTDKTTVPTEKTTAGIPPVTTATLTNRSGSIAVTATDQGLPTRIDVDKSELRYGAQSLADEVLRLTRQATLEAGARRRNVLAEAGLPREVLDGLGLPTREAVIASEDAFEEEETTPTSWLRPV